jgi:hypothetical protein
MGDGTVIVFDTGERKLSAYHLSEMEPCELRHRFQGLKLTTKVSYFRPANSKLPRWTNRFDVYLSSHHDSGPGTELYNSDFITTVKLNTLPLAIDIQRRLGRVRKLYVKVS